MTCPAGANAVSVAASNNNGVTYSGYVDLQITVSDFAMSASPDAATVTAGQSSRHVVTIAPQSGAYNSPVTLSCSSGNLPPQTTCVFDPPAVTPGARGAQSTLTITTSSTAAASLTASRARTSAITTLASGIAVFPSAVTFGSQTLNTTAPQQLVSLTNTGADTLNIASITAGGDFAVVSNCGTAVAAGATCAVAVTFTPTVAGARSGTLSFVDDASGSPHQVPLAGTGVAASSSTGATPAGSYTVTISGTAGTSLAHIASVTLTVQ